MARALRIYFEGAWYHVMNRGINRENIFFNDTQRQQFLRLLGEATETYGIEIHAYCLMTNHYHLIVHTPRGNISEAMKYINSKYASFVNFTIKRDGPLFRGRFKAIIISADDYLIQLSRYIHLNPLEAKIIKILHQYKWSSYPCYINKCKSPQWLNRGEIIKRFGKNNFQNHYKEFVESNQEIESYTVYEKNSIPPAIGSDAFLKMIDDYIKKHSLSAEIVGKDRILAPLKMQEIIDFVSHYFKLNSKSICYGSRFVKNPARKIAIYICRQLGGYSLKEIAEAMGNISYKGISNAIHRVRTDHAQLKLAKKLIARMQKTQKP